MPKHTKLVAIPYDGGQYSFCLDHVLRDDKENETEFAFVWRGDSRSPNSFGRRPAYFTWQSLGEIIRLAIEEDKIDEKEIGSFLKALVGQPHQNKNQDQDTPER